MKPRKARRPLFLPLPCFLFASFPSVPFRLSRRAVSARANFFLDASGRRSHGATSFFSFVPVQASTRFRVYVFKNATDKGERSTTREKAMFLSFSVRANICKIFIAILLFPHLRHSNLRIWASKVFILTGVMSYDCSISRGTRSIFSQLLITLFYKIAKRNTKLLESETSKFYTRILLS